MNALNDQPDLLRTGIFTIPEIAKLVEASPAVVRVWIAGEMPTVVMPSLMDDVVFDDKDNMVAWYPRKKIAPNVIIHPAFSFGRPTLAKSRIPAETLADAVKAEGGARVVAHLFDVPEKPVREAVRFYEDLRKAA